MVLGQYKYGKRFCIPRNKNAQKQKENVQKVLQSMLVWCILRVEISYAKGANEMFKITDNTQPVVRVSYSVELK